MSLVNRLDKFSNPHIRPTWREVWVAKENALRTRFTQSHEKLNSKAHALPPLRTGDTCFVQNGSGNYPKRWDKSGTITEVLDFDRYCVKIDGSGRATIRNRKFLRQYIPVSSTIKTSLASSSPSVDPSSAHPHQPAKWSTTSPRVSFTPLANDNVNGSPTMTKAQDKQLTQLNDSPVIQPSSVGTPNQPQHQVHEDLL